MKYLFLQLWLSLFLFSFSYSAWADPECSRLFIPQTRNTLNDSLELDDDLSYIEMFQKTRARGVMADFFDHQFNTRIYHGNTALPDINRGFIPKVDPRARGLFVFLHGSGTMAASGRNFNSIMNQINAYGFAGLSFDLPYHMDGPIDERFQDPAYFMSWIKRIIDKYRVPGMPVYLIGHSYGATVIPEYLSRYPFSVDGGLSISLVAFNKTLHKWYRQQTSRMTFGGVTMNSAADSWADGVAELFQWNHAFRNEDPTLLNPRLRLRVLTGDHEEYVPGPVGGADRKPLGPNTYNYQGALRKLLKNAEIVVEPGVGHYIFEHKDKSGMNVILREILKVAGIDPSRHKDYLVESEPSSFPFSDTLLSRYSSDPFFRAWLVKKMSFYQFFQLIKKWDERISKKLIEQYESFKSNREAEIIHRMAWTKEEAPLFWEKFGRHIEKGEANASLLLSYAQLINGHSEKHLRQFHPAP